MSFEIKVDEELSLRLVEPRYAEEVYEAVNANREHIGRWLGWLTDSYSLESSSVRAAQCLKDFADRKQLAVTLIVDGQVVGASGWTCWNQETLHDGRLETSSADIGYWLIESAQGKGLVTRAVRALTTLAIETYDIRRVTIHAEPENEKSWKVAERLGYTYEGTLRDVFRCDGRVVNHKLYSMLAEEWKP